MARSAGGLLPFCGSVETRSERDVQNVASSLSASKCCFNSAGSDATTINRTRPNFCAMNRAKSERTEWVEERNTATLLIEAGDRQIYVCTGSSSQVSLTLHARFRHLPLVSRQHDNRERIAATSSISYWGYIGVRGLGVPPLLSPSGAT